jgi:hypothetical protein
MSKRAASSRPLRGWAAAFLPPLAVVFLGAWFVDPAVLPAAENGRATLTLAGGAERWRCGAG